MAALMTTWLTHSGQHVAHVEGLVVKAPRLRLCPCLSTRLDPFEERGDPDVSRHEAPLSRRVLTR